MAFSLCRVVAAPSPPAELVFAASNTDAGRPNFSDGFKSILDDFLSDPDPGLGDDAQYFNNKRLAARVSKGEISEHVALMYGFVSMHMYAVRNVEKPTSLMYHVGDIPLPPGVIHSSVMLRREAMRFANMLDQLHTELAQHIHWEQDYDPFYDDLLHKSGVALRDQRKFGPSDQHHPLISDPNTTFSGAIAAFLHNATHPDDLRFTGLCTENSVVKAGLRASLLQEWYTKHKTPKNQQGHIGFAWGVADWKMPNVPLEPHQEALAPTAPKNLFEYPGLIRNCAIKTRFEFTEIQRGEWQIGLQAIALNLWDFMRKRGTSDPAGQRMANIGVKYAPPAFAPDGTQRNPNALAAYAWAQYLFGSSKTPADIAQAQTFVRSMELQIPSMTPLLRDTLAEVKKSVTKP